MLVHMGSVTRFKGLHMFSMSVKRARLTESVQWTVTQTAQFDRPPLKPSWFVSVRVG